MLVHSPSSRMHLCTSRTFLEPCEPHAHSLRYPLSLWYKFLFYVWHLSSPVHPLLFQLQGCVSILSLIYLPHIPLLFDSFLTLQVHYSNCITHPIYFLSLSLHVLSYASLSTLPYFISVPSIVHSLSLKGQMVWVRVGERGVEHYSFPHLDALYLEHGWVQVDASY